MNDRGSREPTKINLGPDCTLRNAGAIAASLRQLANSGSGVEIDCTGIEQADITFVQVIVSAERSFGARDLCFAMLAVTESARSAFDRAGVSLPGARPRFEPSRN